MGAAWPSLARSCSTYWPSTSGVNVGAAVLASERDGAAPSGADETVHSNRIGSPFGSVVPVPSRVTDSGRLTVRAAPAFTTGAKFSATTVSVSWALQDRPSVTTSERTKGPFRSGVRLGRASAVDERAAALPCGRDESVHSKRTALPLFTMLSLPSSWTSVCVGAVRSDPAEATSAAESGQLAPPWSPPPPPPPHPQTASRSAITHRLCMLPPLTHYGHAQFSVARVLSFALELHSAACTQGRQRNGRRYLPPPTGRRRAPCRCRTPATSTRGPG